MRRLLRSIALPAAAVLLLAAGCGDDGPSTVSTTAAPPATPTTVAPTTTEPGATPTPVSFTTGAATAEIIGDENVSIDFQLDTQQFNDYDPEDGQADLEYRGGDDGLLRMTLTFEGGVLTDAFIAIGLGGELAGDENYYYDAFHSLCEVTAEPFDGTTIRGAYTCEDLPEDSGGTIDATGTFEASA